MAALSSWTWAIPSETFCRSTSTATTFSSRRAERKRSKSVFIDVGGLLPNKGGTFEGVSTIVPSNWKCAIVLTGLGVSPSVSLRNASAHCADAGVTPAWMNNRTSESVEIRRMSLTSLMNKKFSTVFYGKAANDSKAYTCMPTSTYRRLKTQRATR